MTKHQRELAHELPFSMMNENPSRGASRRAKARARLRGPLVSLRTKKDIINAIMHDYETYSYMDGWSERDKADFRRELNQSYTKADLIEQYYEGALQGDMGSGADVVFLGALGFTREEALEAMEPWDSPPRGFYDDEDY